MIKQKKYMMDRFLLVILGHPLKKVETTEGLTLLEKEELRYTILFLYNRK
jgi:hypothetical protein